MRNFKFKEPILGVHEFDRNVHLDERGYFTELCNEQLEGFLEVKFVQDNVSYNQKAGTWRGLHAQREPHAQGKLVTCLQGKAMVVVVDIRKNSDTLLKHDIFLMSERKSLYVPEGCLHGFLTAQEDVLFHYKVTKPYHKESSIVVNVKDPTLGIRLDDYYTGKLTMSNSDATANYLSKFVSYQWTGDAFQ
tara:strand:- start:44031 stop:44600 length:570 start_codon:yes stop_codon:yes gene_type:complete